MSYGISLLVVNYGTPELLKSFLFSIENNIKRKDNFEVTLIDNNYPRKGDSRKVIMPSEFSFKIQFVQNPESSYASGINLGANLASYDIIIAANSDIEILPQFSFEPFIDIFKQDARIGIIGPQLLHSDGTWQRSYGPVPSFKEAISSLMLFDAFSHAIYRYFMSKVLLSRRIKEVEYVDGAFMVIRRKCFEQCHGFNERYTFYAEDADFCWRAGGLGWKTVFLPNIRIIHLRGASSIKKSFIKYTPRLFNAKLQFVKEHFGDKRAQQYRQLMKSLVFQRYLFYSLISSIVPFYEFELRKRQFKLFYFVVKKFAKI